MKKLLRYTCQFVAATLLPVAASTQGNLSGLWRTSNDALVHIKDSSSAFIAVFLVTGDCADGHRCPLGGNNEYYLKGTKTANKLDLTMLRCTHKKAMRDEGLSDRWTTTCKVNTVTNTSIEGTWRTNWYWNDFQDGREFNFRRDAAEDKDSPFGLNRTNCLDELNRLVAEIELKAQMNEEIQSALNDEDKRFGDAKQEWVNEVKDQLKEEVFHTVVPPTVKIVPGTYEQDEGSYIESWLDFAKELAEKGKNFTLEKATKIVLLWDLLIDWGNVTAKGIVTVEEMEQINSSMINMQDSKLSNLTSWIQALAEYHKLSEYCAKEIPPAKQPKFKSSFPMDGTEFKRNIEKAAATQRSVISDIRAADDALRNNADQLKKLKTLLEPHRNADSTKTMGQVLQESGIQKLQKELETASLQWAELFKALQKIRNTMLTLKQPSSKPK